MAASAAKLDGDVEDGKAASKSGGMKKKIIIGAAVAALLAAGGGGYVMMQKKKAVAEAQAKATKKTAFFDLPEITVNLAGQPGQERPLYLRLKVALEVEDAKVVAEITPLMPRVVDNFQIFLRELRPADLEGSAGLYRLKEELVRRVNTAVYPAKVDAILFKDVLVQ